MTGGGGSPAGAVSQRVPAGPGRYSWRRCLKTAAISAFSALFFP
jgi:hypothetical protein